MWTGALVLLLVGGAPPAAATGREQPTAAADCATWQACRDDVEAALAEEAVERAHDLAWRAVQRGPKDDPALMFLLARAQARAGRPQDALVMIRRLAERGVATEALSHPDLERSRALDSWAEVEPLVVTANSGGRVNAPPAPLAPAGSPAAARTPDRPAKPAAPVDLPRSAAAAPASAPAGAPAAGVTLDRGELTESSLRFSADRFVPSGLAYDAVSQRFVMGDRDGRKLRVVGEGLDHAVDLVRAESAGFLDVRALAIDTRRGDLWVASGEATGAATLHRIQLISGRPLQSLAFAGETAARPVDLAVAENGAVLVLSADGRILRARAGATSIELVMSTDAAEATSLALASPDVAYVSHAGGLIRADVPGKSAVPVVAAAELPLNGIERLRPHRNGFVALQRGEDGARQLLRLELTRNGRAVRGATTYDVRVGAGSSPVAFTVSGDEIALVTDATRGEPAAPSAGPPAELIVRRFRLQ